MAAEDFLDARRSADQLRVTGQEQRRRPADVRRSHTGSVHRVFQLARDEADDLFAGGYKIRLGAPVPRRPAPGEKADAVGVRLVAVGGADRDHGLAVAGLVMLCCCSLRDLCCPA